MKKFISVIATLAVAVFAAKAQDLATITELYNTGATALSSDQNESALATFQKVLTLAEALPNSEGAELAGSCKDIIPSVALAVAKDYIKKSDYDGALTKLSAALELAGKYGKTEVADEINGLVPQILNQKAGTLLNAKDYAGAAAVYKQIVDADPTNGTALYRMGVALNALGKVDEAKAALEQAMTNGQEAGAKKQLSNIFLREAAASLKTKKYGEAVDFALKANEYLENSQAIRVAAQASQLAGKSADAIKYFEQYLTVAPNAKDATTIAFTLGALYQQSKNNAKAKEFYSKAVSDPKLGAQAKQLLDALK